MAGYLEPYAKTTTLDSYALKTDLDDYATKEELNDYLTTDIAAKTYAAASDLQTLIANLGMPADFKEGDTPVLQDIFNQLSELST